MKPIDLNDGSLRSTIVRLLTANENLRDSDKQLIRTIWEEELGGKTITDTMTAAQFLDKLSNEEVLTNSESIRRSRQLLQERMPELRGKLYAQRQEKGRDTRDGFRNGTI